MGLQRLLPCEVAMGLREEREGREGEQESPLLRCGSGGTGLDGRGGRGREFV